VVVDAPPGETFAQPNWEALRATGLEPPQAAVLAHQLGMGAVATEAELIAALARAA
jgi:hypothetical protein